MENGKFGQSHLVKRSPVKSGYNHEIIEIVNLPHEHASNLISFSRKALERWAK